jgi:hypothetical protein
VEDVEEYTLTRTEKMEEPVRLPCSTVRGGHSLVQATFLLFTVLCAQAQQDLGALIAQARLASNTVTSLSVSSGTTELLGTSLAIALPANSTLLLTGQGSSSELVWGSVASPITAAKITLSPGRHLTGHGSWHALACLPEVWLPMLCGFFMGVACVIERWPGQRAMASMDGGANQSCTEYSDNELAAASHHCVPLVPVPCGIRSFGVLSTPAQPLHRPRSRHFPPCCATISRVQLSLGFCRWFLAAGARLVLRNLTVLLPSGVSVRVALPTLAASAANVAWADGLQLPGISLPPLSAGGAPVAGAMVLQDVLVLTSSCSDLLAMQVGGWVHRRHGHFPWGSN